jgi:Tfp pilus assembly protein PilF
LNRKLRRAGGKLGTVAPAVQQSFTVALQHHKVGNLGESERLFQQVLAIDPRHRDSLHMLGLIAFQTGRAARAAELVRRAIALDPREASAHSNLGNILLQDGKVDDAVACYRRAIELRPDFTSALNNLGNALKAQSQFAAAIASYDKALALVPHDAEVRYNRALALLASGDFAAGWEAHEGRFNTPQLRAARRDFVQPQWRGEAGQGRTLLIHAEQGFGDTLQFCRYAPLAAARGWRVVLEAPQPLVRLLETLQGVSHVLARGRALPAFDAHCPMMSLPLALGSTLETTPGATPYLHADAAATAVWHARLGSAGLRVGLVWAGNPRKGHVLLAAADRRRSIAPARLAPLFAAPGMQFVSLQKDGPALPEGAPVLDYMGEMNDFADTAALVANLDLVISVDTSVAHLAGALGKKVWLLDRYDGCWRWLAGRRDSPWYPGLRLYRHEAPGDWGHVVGEIAGELKKEASASF